MRQTTSTERRAAGGDRPRSGGSVNLHPVARCILKLSVVRWSVVGSNVCVTRSFMPGAMQATHATGWKN